MKKRFIISPKIIVELCLVFIFSLAIPWLWFGRSLLLGGDDTRLYFVYPERWLEVFRSHWYEISQVGIAQVSTQYVPLITIFSLIKKIGFSGLYLHHIIYTTLIFFSLLSMRFALHTLFNHLSLLTQYSVCIFFLFSPIVMTKMIHPLIYIWILGYAPLILVFIYKYLRYGYYKYLIFIFVFSFCFSAVIYSIPWFIANMGVLLGVLFSRFELYSRESLKRIFFILVVFWSSQIHYLIPIIGSTFLRGNSYLGFVFGDDVYQSFFAAVNELTYNARIDDALVNQMTRSLVYGYDWEVKPLYERYYYYTYYTGLVYPVLLLLATLFARSFKSRLSHLILLINMSLFLMSFVVNIPIFKQLFLMMGHIPGFAMFRNFFDKFAIAFVLSYAFALASSLSILQQHQWKRSRTPQIIQILFLFVTLANSALSFTPIYFNRPLIGTTSIDRKISSIPQEYLEFLDKVKQSIPLEANIISLPYGIAAYTTFIDKANPQHLYIGTSPVHILTGLSDFSGNLSFSPANANEINRAIQNTDLIAINKYLARFNIRYAIVTNNLPNEYLSSYLFNKDILKKQFAAILPNAIELFNSSNQNYVLYKLPIESRAVESTFIERPQINLITLINKLHSGSYKIQIVLPKDELDLNQTVKILLRENYNSGWQLQPFNLVATPNDEGFNTWQLQNIRDLCVSNANICHTDSQHYTLDLSIDFTLDFLTPLSWGGIILAFIILLARGITSKK